MQPVKARERVSPGKPISGWARWGGRALVLTGGLWMITHLAGVLDGRLIDPDFFDGSALMWIGMIASEVAQLCLGTGLIVLGTRLWTHAKRLAAAGLALWTTTPLSPTLAFVPFSSFPQTARLP